MSQEDIERRMRRTMSERLEGLRRTNWWIITGGPSTGKSALLKNLEQRGYKIIEEAARDEINIGRDKGRTIEQIRADEVEFQLRVLRRKEQLEDETPERQLTFWDRGLDGDSLAYLHFAKRPQGYPSSIYDSPPTIVARRRYQGIFLLDQLPYEQDYARTEDSVKGAQIHHQIGLEYKIIGYEPVQVSVFPGNEAVSINQRAQFIIDHVRRKSPRVPNLLYPFPIPVQGSLVL
jgi:predicted ATPase